MCKLWKKIFGVQTAQLLFSIDFIKIDFLKTKYIINKMKIEKKEKLQLYIAFIIIIIFKQKLMCTEF